MKALLPVLLVLFPVLANAADINCKGKVTWVMDYPHQCSGNTAFRTSASNGKWICPPSDKGNAIVLAALAAGKSIEVYIDDKNGSISCSSLPDYVSARYIIINP
ncbi:MULTISPECIES: hypothetical protein [Pseudoalteromonas]|uniref:hypothetical protein n=1 Tax=Pseudoalteromonas TaxID=53246 RepID=UPI001EF5B58F|nr:MULTISPECIES: hypothetical protein [Pseudoalteromonas]MCG7561481.1 hypothetical protein [Pseudoalteromonas sp. McH1-42]MEC4088069.1 hypothetical protein [Pseudoalteromonas rubra]